MFYARVMAVNETRRRLLADSALAVLGSTGGRGLTHRAVDLHAAVPIGTCANYFPTRAELFRGMGERIFERIAPEQHRLAELAALDPDTRAFVAYTRYVVERLLREPDLALALIELRLEAARNPQLAAQIAPVLRAGLDADVEFNAYRGLPASRRDITLLHYAIDGIVLDRVTTPLVPGDDPLEAAEELARHLLSS